MNKIEHHSLNRTITEQFLHAKQTELAVPIQFIEEITTQSLPDVELSSHSFILLSEYAGAHGYADSWGHIIESKIGAHIIWRFIPLEIWNKTYLLRKYTTATIPGLITLLQKEVHPFLKSHLPAEVALTGIHQNRRYPHALFGLLLIDVARETLARRWIAETLFSELLPAIISMSSMAATRILNNLNAAIFISSDQRTIDDNNT